MSKRPMPGDTVTTSILEAAHQGKYATLVALRDQLAVRLDDPKTMARDIASLSKRLLETMSEIEAIEGLEEEARAHELPDEEFDPTA